MLAAALCYWVLPDVRQRFRYITPGSLTATVLWLASTWVFTRAVDQFGRFNVTYGSIAGVMVLLVWMYISGLVFLVGGELNAAIEHTLESGKAKGARAEGEPPLPEEERPGFMPIGAAKSAATARRARGKWKLRFWKNGARSER